MVRRSLTLFAVAALHAAAGTWTETTEAADARNIMPARDFVDMIGICVHMPYTDGAYAKLANVLLDFKYLGVRHARDGIPDTNGVPALQARDAHRRMVFDGIKFNMLFPSGWNSSWAIGHLINLEKAVRGSVASVEGYNEINNFPVSYGEQKGSGAAVAGQQALYAAIKAEPDLKHIPVIDMTGFEMVDDLKSSYGRTLKGFADVMNIHEYPQNGDQPGRGITPERHANYKSTAEVLPKAITEFGYSSMPESGWLVIGVDERTQAQGILNGIFDAARSGYQKIYVYELLDQKPDPAMKEREFHFGLFTFENKPKVAAQAIRNLTTILADAPIADVKKKTSALPSDTSPKIKVDVADAKYPVFSLGLMKDDGSVVAAVWREAPFWDRAKGQPIEATPIQAQVSFGKTCGSIRLYDVLQSSDPISVHGDGPLKVSLGQSVQLIECAKLAKR